MENPLERILDIHFMDGSTVKVSFRRQTEDRCQHTLMIEEL